MTTCLDYFTNSINPEPRDPVRHFFCFLLACWLSFELVHWSSDIGSFRHVPSLRNRIIMQTKDRLTKCKYNYNVILWFEIDLWLFRVFFVLLLSQSELLVPIREPWPKHVQRPPLQLRQMETNPWRPWRRSGKHQWRLRWRRKKQHHRWCHRNQNQHRNRQRPRPWRQWRWHHQWKLWRLSRQKPKQRRRPVGPEVPPRQKPRRRRRQSLTRCQPRLPLPPAVRKMIPRRLVRWKLKRILKYNHRSLRGRNTKKRTLAPVDHWPRQTHDWRSHSFVKVLSQLGVHDVDRQRDMFRTFVQDDYESECEVNVNCVKC